MSNTLTEIPGSDRRGRLQVDALLEREGIPPGWEFGLYLRHL